MDDDRLKEKLIDKCLEFGLPVSSDDNVESLQFYLSTVEEENLFDNEKNLDLEGKI